MNYTMPNAISGDTFDGVRWTITIDGTPLDLTSAVIEMVMKKDRTTYTYSTTNGKLTIISPATSGIFELQKQIVDLKVGGYTYEIIFRLSGGIVKTYINGTWTITEN